MRSNAKRVLMTRLAYVLALGAAAPGFAQAFSQTIYGVARAGDGDSLEINGQRFRLFGIDAPEFDQTCTKGGAQWACGAEAADQLSRLVTGREVRCVANGVDQYQRLLARCSVGGMDVNAAMVERGYAIAFRKYSSDYVAAEARAKAARRGIWAGTFETPSSVRAEGRSYRSAKRPAPSRSSAAPQRAAGSCVIKGNKSRRGEWIYHVPGMPYYEQTQAEEMFCSEAEARAAGYRRAIVR